MEKTIFGYNLQPKTRLIVPSNIMSKSNPLLGLVGIYGDSDDETDDEVSHGHAAQVVTKEMHKNAGVHPPPIPHCPWSACYDENSGFTYYWNQQTNAVTWEAPPEYLLALKLAQQQLHKPGSTEVSAEEWKLYQQALADKQAQKKGIVKPPIAKTVKIDKNMNKNGKPCRKRPINDEDDDNEKIELITSYSNSNSDSDSNDEATPVKPEIIKQVLIKPKQKKLKTKPPTMEYGPSLPPTQNYKTPIGPEIPQTQTYKKPIGPEMPQTQNYKTPIGPEMPQTQNYKTPIGPEMPQTQNYKMPIEQEIPQTQNYKVPIEPEVSVQIKQHKSKEHTTKIEEDEEGKKATIENDDENSLLEQLKNKAKILQKLGGDIPSELQDIIQDEKSMDSLTTVDKEESKGIIDTNIDELLEEIEKKELPKVKTKLNYEDSNTNSPKPETSNEEFKPLFPSTKFIEDTPKSLFPSATKIKENGETCESAIVAEKSGTNLYLIDSGDAVGVTSRKKRRIDIPVRKPVEATYTTKYSQYIDGFSSERTGLGFNNDDGSQSPKSTIKYGNGLTFTKGEVLNEDKSEDLEESVDLVKAKLEFLCQQQESQVSPVQEMLIQLQTLLQARAGGALAGSHLSAWARSASAALAGLEARAAPPGWSCHFLRSEGRYRYRREADGLLQWEFPATASMDMEICTTPPHPVPDEQTVVPSESEVRVLTPPPPAWRDPSPPKQEPKKEITDALASFYSDIAELDKEKEKPPSGPPSAPTSAPHSAPPSPPEPAPDHDKRDREQKNKRKSKVKISSSMGIKHKSVSSMVAKWQQVAEEINSD